VSPGKPPPRTNFRRNLRVPVRVEVREDAGGSSHGYAINISPTGMGLQSSEAYKPGLSLQLRFSFGASDQSVELDSEVIWCMRDSDLSPGMIYYELGVRFVDVPSDVQGLLDSFVERTGCDQGGNDLHDLRNGSREKG